jgi:hypothetical protein
MSGNEEEKQLWSFKELKSQGWTSCKGTGLVSYYYFRPGFNINNIKDGIAGEDYFYSEEEIQVWYEEKNAGSRD